jgi:hypothetical protein
VSDPNPATVQFLEAMAAGQAGYLSFFDLNDRSHTHFRTDDLESAGAFATHASGLRHNVYVRANVQAGPTGATAASVSALTALTSDFDVEGPGHKTAHRLPSSFADLFTILEKAEVPEPTRLLSTGGGLLAVWVLEEPIIIRSEADRERAKDLSRKFQRRIAQVAKDMDMHIDPTFDLVRACRIPGTRNWKPAYGPMGAPVEVYQ